ncbi:DNA alkylation repair protein [Arachnia propionica]|uniref:DNA alkylation repair protein n=1 Tax=Arachnia propionica TaxID=1750 RepID=A0A3P1T7R5_9ACTN|nr:DNA alkylation repair protein [Arachnia propionica]RRD05454.1 DNA alkylation repair protein [Arachnia propionica]
MLRPVLPDVLAELESLADPKALAVNRRHGDAHSVNLTKVRGIAKQLGAQPELARALWATRQPNARLVALLVARPKQFTVAELDRWLREAATNKETDWFVSYLAAKSRHAEELRTRWLADPEPRIAAAGWALTTDRVVKNPEGLDLAALLDVIEAEMKDAPERLQWAMNTCLGNIGIEHESYRERVLEIGERLEVLKNHPTSGGCISPYVPVWVPEVVQRRTGRA